MSAKAATADATASIGERRVGYTDAARNYIEMTAGDRLTARRMTRIALGTLAALLVSIVGNIYQAQLPREVPYVIRESANGSVGVGATLSPATRPDEAWIRYELARWIVEVRSKTSDASVQNQFAMHTAALVLGGSPAQTMVLAHTQTATSGVAQRVSVKIDFVRTRNGSANIYESEWTETAIDEKGHASAPQRWSGVVTINFAQSQVTLPDAQDVAYSNPYGMYISDIQWNQLRY